MFAKLLRLECRAMGRILLPLMGAVLAFSGLAMLAVLLAGPDALMVSGGPAGEPARAVHGALFHLVLRLLVVGVFLSMAALMITCVVVTLQRFYKNLLGDEGYLMLALPASPAEHLAAKLTASLAWTSAALTLVLALVFGLVGSIRVLLPDGRTPLTFLLNSLHEGIPVPLWQWYAGGALLWFVGVANSYLMMYLSMALGTQRTTGRLGASIAVYVVLQLLVNSLMGLAAWLAGVLGLECGFNPLAGLSAAGQLLAAGGGSLILLGLGSLVWFFAARWMLEHRVNLL